MISNYLVSNLVVVFRNDSITLWTIFQQIFQRLSITYIEIREGKEKREDSCNSDIDPVACFLFIFINQFINILNEVKEIH